MSKYKTYLFDSVLAISMGAILIIQGISIQPNLMVMGICIVVLLGRTALAVAVLTGQSNTTPPSQPPVQSTSQHGAASSQTGSSNDPSP